MQNNENALIPKRTLGMHPQKFALWIFIVSVIMLFAAMTSAYMVRQAEGNWFVFELPPMFYYSTAVILASSLTMHWAYLAAKNDWLSQLRWAIGATTLFGGAFLYMQVAGFGELVEMNVYFSGGNPAGSFVYVIAGLHGAHLVSALVFLILVLVAAFRFDIHSKRMVRIEMCATYWHFLDALWLYLFVFMLMNR